MSGPPAGGPGIIATNISSRISLSGERLETAGIAVVSGGGQIELTGYHIISTNTDPVIAFPQGNLSLNAVRLDTINGTNSIRAPSPTMVTLNAVSVNKPLGPNVAPSITNATFFGEVNALALSFTPTLLAGVGGANTNFTLALPAGETWVNGFTNVSLRAVMGTDTNIVRTWTLTITNGAGVNRTLEFSAVTNRWRFNGTYGTNAPNTLTNGTQLVIAGRSLGTNTLVNYTYYPWP